jgi:hypothetical protein
MDQGDELIQLTGPLGDMDWVEALDLGVLPESYEKLSILRGRVWNEAITLLGIDSANQDKKERMVVAEVGANDSQTDSFRFVSLNARRQACEMINEVFDLEVTVDFMTKIEEEEAAEFADELHDSNSQDGNEVDDNDARLKAVK